MSSCIATEEEFDSAQFLSEAWNAIWFEPTASKMAPMIVNKVDMINSPKPGCEHMVRIPNLICVSLMHDVSESASQLIIHIHIGHVTVICPTQPR